MISDKLVFINNRYFFAHCFFLRKKGVQEKIYRSERVFERKIENFSFKNTLTTKKSSLYAFRA